jgi:hypothetical protein
MKRWFLSCLVLAFVGISIRAEDAPLFNGKDLTGWLPKNADNSKWKVGSATLDPKDSAKLAFSPEGSELVNTAVHSCDLSTARKFGDCTVEVEFMIPKGSNSGVYLMGEYEVQVLDSYGKDKVGPGDMGGIYANAAPRVNACKKPGEWQKFVIDFQASRFENGKKTANAKFIKVTLNDQLLHENFEVKGPTPGGLTGKESATGPLMIQGDHGPITIRTIKVMPK